MEFRSEFNRHKRNVKEFKRTLANTERELDFTAEALDLARQAVITLQDKTQEAISHVVAKCLQDVFGEEYDFRIEFTQQANKTACSFVVLKDDMKLDPLEEVGGGIADVVSFALRVAALTGTRPPLRQILILDEPFKFVSVQYREAISQLVQTLSEHLGIQFVIVTHIPELEIGNVVRL